MTSAIKNHKNRDICVAMYCSALNPVTRRLWSDYHSALQEKGLELLLLTTAPEEDDLPFTQIQIPFSLKEYADFCPPDAIPEIEKTDSQVKALVKRDMHWLGEGNEDYFSHLAGYWGCRAFYQNLIKQMKPAVAFTWSNTLPQSVLFKRLLDAAEVPNYVMERGFLPETLMLENHGNVGCSDLLNSPFLGRDLGMLEDEQGFKKISDYYLEKRPQKYEQQGFIDCSRFREELGLGKQQVIVFFGQNDFATGAFPQGTNLAKRNNPHFKSTLDAFLELVAVLPDLKDTALVFKPHPHDKTDYDCYGNETIHVVHDAHPHTLMDAADVLVFDCSTLQVEAILFQKPLVTLSRSELIGRNIAYEVQDRSALVGVLQEALGRKDLQDKLKNGRGFLNWLAKNYLFGYDKTIPAGRSIADLGYFSAQVAVAQKQTTDVSHAHAMVRSLRDQLAAANREADDLQLGGLVEEPIFVLGCPRSGTSVLSNTLAQHSSTWIGAESNFMTPLFVGALKGYELGSQRGDAHWLTREQVSLNNFMALIGEGVNRLFTRASGGRRWIEQTPEYTLSMREIGLALPMAKFVFLIRDGRDVVHSMINSSFDVAWSSDFEEACRAWVLFVKAGLDYEDKNPDRVIRVYNETLRHQPESLLKHLQKQLDMEEENTLVEFLAGTSGFNSSFKDKPKSDKWQDSWTLEQRQTFLRIAGPLLCALGYEDSAAWVELPQKPEFTAAPPHKPAREVLQKAEQKPAVIEQPRIQLVEEEDDDTAMVSIVIPVFNNLAYTHKCLKSIIANTAYPRYEVIVVDNASTDDTADYLKKMQAAQVKPIFNDVNMGFVEACNIGAAAADGDFVLFLNNDTEVQPRWLSSLVELMDARSDCGAVGSKLVYPDGTLQEAGGIIFSDANGWNYGRNGDPADPRYNFVREVDYCSGASLMVRKSLWDKIGGFDHQYAPAYYEDTDLCFSIRKEGQKVYYQPESVVIHHEGKTAGTDLNSGFKKYQSINQAKFAKKWQAVLQEQQANHPSNVPAASDRGIRGRIFIADPFLPAYDRASGSLRLFSYIKILRELGYHITFVARILGPDIRYARELQQLGVEVYGNDVAALEVAGYQFHDKVVPVPYETIFSERKFDYAILSFWYIAHHYIPVIREYSPATRIIVDTVDIHFVREKREGELKNDTDLIAIAEQKEKDEIAVYQSADRCWVVTDQDRDAIIDQLPGIPIDIVPNIHQIPDLLEFDDDARDLLFVGNFSHPPNGDAVLFFHQEVWPQVAAELPDAKWYIVGNNPPEEIQALASERIIVTGWVETLEPYFRRARISVSPLRYGAGMKGKIGEALSIGLPVVTTTIGAEGMGLVDGEQAMIADEAQALAAAIIELHRDKDLHSKLARQGRQLVVDRWSTARTRENLATLFGHTLPDSVHQQTPVVSIIMLSYNALEYTEKAIRSIEAVTRIPFELILVENGSTADVKKRLAEIASQRSWITLIDNPKNTGFAAGNNQGAEAAKGKYLMLLNNDVLVADGWLEGLVNVAAQDEKIGLVGPITNHISGRQMVPDVPYTDDIGFYDFAAQVNRVNRGKYTPRRRIAGFAMLVPADLYRSIGGFDEQFGDGNYEDDDLCLRIRQAGYAIMVDEGRFIHHYGSQTFKANKIDYQQNLRERRKLFNERWPEVDYEHLLEVNEKIEDDHERRFNQATEAMLSGDIDAAEPLFRSILEANPLDVNARYGVALVSKAQGNVTEAIKHFKRITRLDSGFAAAYNEMGMMYLESGDAENGKHLFALAVHKEPGYIDALRNYGDALMQLEDYENGLNVFLKILESHPDDSGSLLYLAKANIETGRFQQGIQYIEKVLAHDPENAMAQEMLQYCQNEVAG